ncbi:MAG: SurA N-terminal domain-containing protein [Pyrinomonadaceae bacterium]
MRGVESNVQIFNGRFLVLTLTVILALLAGACPKGGGPAANDKVAATVNGTPIMLQEVERAIKSSAQGQELKLSQMELAQARLQVLEQLISQEVMYQKAQKENTIPNDEEVNAELNKLKSGAGVSKEEFEKKLKDAGQTEELLKESLKKEIASRKLIEKITGKIEAPSEAEVTGFYNGNKAFFVKKRGVELAAIVVDPSVSGPNDPTKSEADAIQRFKEIGLQLQSVDFASVAREKSEDPSAARGGDLGNISEEDLKKSFSADLAATFMSDKTQIGAVLGPVPIQGKFYIFKLKNRIEKDEDLTLESPGVKQQITETLTNTKKQLLAASYTAVAMNEAKVVNFLAQQIIDNPNELSGARPVTSDDKKDDAAKTDESNSNTADNTNTGNTNTAVDSNSNANAADGAKKDDAAAKTEGSDANAKPAAGADSNSNANTK